MDQAGWAKGMHVTCSIATLSTMAAALLAITGAGPGPIQVQSAWADSTASPDTEVKQKSEQSEAERAERRKAYGPVVYPKFMQGGERPDFKPLAPPIVYFDQREETGSIIVDTQNRKLYYVLPDKKAFEYPISVGRDGFTWSGSERISRIAEWPSWTPPPEMHKRVPGLPLTVTGGLKNPQGARALYLGGTIYRIHGTNNDRTVGRANSSGCFRLMNEHVVHLASIAKIGTKVKVLQAYNGGVSQSAPMTSLFGFGESGEPQKAASKARPSKPLVKRAAAAAATAPPVAKKAVE
jgi:lipoprotein-anchoring transpeptidase ErfK/SrfK